jgi:hypothetical protein
VGRSVFTEVISNSWSLLAKPAGDVSTPAVYPLLFGVSGRDNHYERKEVVIEHATALHIHLLTNDIITLGRNIPSDALRVWVLGTEGYV